MRQLFVGGSYFKSGVEIGSVGKKYIKQLLRRDKNLLSVTQKKQKSLLSFLFRKLNKEFPDYINELKGIASGAGVDFDYLFLENCPEVLGKFDGCTSAAVKTKKSNFIIHNEDDEGWRTIKNYALIHYKFPKIAYSAFTFLGELSGNAFNWNNQGLFFCVDYLPSLKKDLEATPRYFVTRRLLESKNLSAGLNFLKRIKSASAFHYLLADGKRFVSVEKLLDQSGITNIRSLFLHTNHYIHPIFKKQTRQNGEKSNRNSFLRFQIASKNLSLEISPSEAARLWTDQLKRPLNKYDTNKTFATALADFNRRKIFIYSMAHIKKPLIFKI